MWGLFCAHFSWSVTWIERTVVIGTDCAGPYVAISCKSRHVRASRQDGQRTASALRREINSRRARHIVQVVAHGDKEVKKELPSGLHLHLHGATALEGGPTSDDERQVVRPHLRVRVGRIGVGEAGACEDGAALDARLQALLAQRQPLELVESVLLGGAVDDRVLEYGRVGDRVEDGRVDAGGAVLELPNVATLAEAQGGKIVA